MYSEPVFIIAEAGVNHNGSLELAKKMVTGAAKAGADAIKFQTFTADTLVTKKAVQADYQKASSNRQESQYDMLKNLELSFDDHLNLMETCKFHGIEFLSSPFDLTAIDLLQKIGVKKWKIPSGEITNLPYLRKIASFDQDIILSTGMADLEEIKAAVVALEKAGISSLRKITLLQCTTEYPAPLQEVNLNAMQTLKTAFPGVTIGYSDHTRGIEIAIAAVAMGATVIEKHFTLDKKMVGPDHKASLLAAELNKLIQAVRNVELALGDGIKQPTPSERKNICVARKSIVAACEIASGEKFTPKNLTVKRPGDGISPMQWDKIIGRRAAKNYKKDEPIER